MIKKISNYFLGNTLVWGSTIILLGSVIANFGSYLFHLVMGRLLGPADYGILESLISISYFLAIPTSVLGLVVVKFVSQNSSNKETISQFVKKSWHKLSAFGFMALLVFLFAFPILKRLVKIDSFSLFLSLGIFSYFGILSVIFSSALQGMLRFIEVSLLNIFSAWSKLIFGVLLVIFGLRVAGAINALVLTSLASLVLSYKLLKKLLPTSSGNISLKDSWGEIKTYSSAVFLSNMASTSFFTADIILARHFLTPVAAGHYASLSVLGKIIFFASSPVVSVMFPMVSERQANGENYQKLFWTSLLIVLVISILISIIYFIFPKLMVSLLFGKEYLEIASSLGLFAVFISIYSLCSLLVGFFLSISETRIIFFSVGLAILQIILINFYHQSIKEIILVNIATLLLWLFVLLIYLFKNRCLQLNKLYEQ